MTSPKVSVTEQSFESKVSVTAIWRVILIPPQTGRYNRRSDGLTIASWRKIACQGPRGAYESLRQTRWYDPR